MNRVKGAGYNDQKRTCTILARERGTQSCYSGKHVCGASLWCLFIGHVVLEKIPKALFVLSNEKAIPPKTPNLVKLANLASGNLNREQDIFLDEVNDFNLETRSPDYKFAFYQRCTKEFTEAYFHKIKDQIFV